MNKNNENQASCKNLLVAFEMCGKHGFVFNVDDLCEVDKALEQVRLRCKYVNKMMENFVEELLTQAKLNRTNVLYSSDEFACLLLPDEQQVKETLNALYEKWKKQIVQRHGIDLYIAGAGVFCSEEDSVSHVVEVSNSKQVEQKSGHGEPKCPNQFGNLQKPFCSLLSKLADAEVSRYTASEIYQMNFASEQADNLGEGFSVCVSADEKINECTGITEKINHLCALKIEADDLMSLLRGGGLRTITFARAMNNFFTHKVKDILEEKGYTLQVVFSSDNSVFAIGNYNDAINASIDIYNAWSGLAFAEFAEFARNNMPAINASISTFSKNYPISCVALETEKLIGASSQTKGAVALGRQDMVFTWDELVHTIVPRKREIASVLAEFENNASFAHKILALLHNYDDVISAPRLAYLLARFFENKNSTNNRNNNDTRGKSCKSSDSPAPNIPNHQADDICSKIFSWSKDEKQRRLFIAALEWYINSANTVASASVTADADTSANIATIANTSM